MRVYVVSTRAGDPKGRGGDRGYSIWHEGRTCTKGHEGTKAAAKAAMARGQGHSAGHEGKRGPRRLRGAREGGCGKGCAGEGIPGGTRGCDGHEGKPGFRGTRAGGVPGARGGTGAGGHDCIVHRHQQLTSDANRGSLNKRAPALRRLATVFPLRQKQVGIDWGMGSLWLPWGEGRGLPGASWGKVKRRAGLPSGQPVGMCGWVSGGRRGEWVLGRGLLRALAVVMEMAVLAEVAAGG